MQITITYAHEDGDPRSGPVTIGWLREPETSGVLYAPPERVSTRPPNRGHAKSAARCPAVTSLEARHFLIRCPFDLHVGFARSETGQPRLVNRAGPMGSVRFNKLVEAFVLVREEEWRHPERPMVQLKLPYVFVADEPVFLSQIDAYAHYRSLALPGIIVGGRFPIHIWPRPIMWGFEWHDPDKDLVLRRGDPLFYVQFESEGPERPIQLVEAERTPELLRYMDHIAGAVGYASQTFGLFRQAEAERPARLLLARDRR